MTAAHTHTPFLGQCPPPDTIFICFTREEQSEANYLSEVDKTMEMSLGLNPKAYGAEYNVVYVYPTLIL